MDKVFKALLAREHRNMSLLQIACHTGIPFRALLKARAEISTTRKFKPSEVNHAPCRHTSQA